MQSTQTNTTKNQYAVLAEMENDEEDNIYLATNNDLTPNEQEDKRITTNKTIKPNDNEMTQIDELEGDITKTLYCKLFEENVVTEYDRQKAYYE